MSAPSLISIVTPAHNEQTALPTLVAAIAQAMEGRAYELIIVDDGSTDSTWTVVQGLAARYPQVRGLRLTRNFGHQAAILAGLGAAAGDPIITLDSDGQHPPSLIPTLLDQWQHGSPVVQAVRVKAEDETWFKRVTSKAFYSLLGRLGGPKVPPGSADYRLLSRSVVATVLDSVGPLVFLRGLIPWLGYPTAYVPFSAAPRDGGTPTYTLKRMIRFSVHGLMSFSIVPLRLAILAGFGVAALSFTYLLIAVGAYIFSGHVVQGWASVMGLLSLLGGIQLITIGLLGEYVGRLFVGGLNRPHFVVLEQTRGSDRT